MLKYSLRHFSSIPSHSPVLIVGAGPVGMITSAMLTHFKIDNAIIDRASHLQDHPKAHYISFRTCEILKDLGLGGPLEEKLESIEYWSKFNYKSHVLGGHSLGRVDHFDWSWRKTKQAHPESPLLESFDY